MDKDSKTTHVRFSTKLIFFFKNNFCLRNQNYNYAQSVFFKTNYINVTSVNNLSLGIVRNNLNIFTHNTSYWAKNVRRELSLKKHPHTHMHVCEVSI